MSRRSEAPQLRELRELHEPTELRELRELRREAAGLGRDPARRRRSPRTDARRRRALLLGGITVVLLVVVLLASSGGPRSFALPSRSSLARLGLGERIVAIANSQVGYATDPSGSYCNTFSGYWGVGGGGCPGDERSEKWCADFAAWAWRHAGVRFPYGYGAGDINAGAVSFYEWAVDTGHWHPARSGYRAAAGDVAVYGLSLSGVPSAAHVAVVVSDPRGQTGPDVINGDGDRTGFSVVETGTDQVDADTGQRDTGVLAGYASP